MPDPPNKMLLVCRATRQRSQEYQTSMATVKVDEVGIPCFLLPSFGVDTMYLPRMEINGKAQNHVFHSRMDLPLDCADV